MRLYDVIGEMFNYDCILLKKNCDLFNVGLKTNLHLTLGRMALSIGNMWMQNLQVD